MNSSVVPRTMSVRSAAYGILSLWTARPSSPLSQIQGTRSSCQAGCE